MECASLCNNSLPDDCSCLKFCLGDAKVHQIILQRSKICMLNGKRVLNMPKFKQKPNSFRWLQLHNLVYIVPVIVMIEFSTCTVEVALGWETLFCCCWVAVAEDLFLTPCCWETPLFSLISVCCHLNLSLKVLTFFGTFLFEAAVPSSIAWQKIIHWISNQLLVGRCFCNFLNVLNLNLSSNINTWLQGIAKT